MFRHRFPLIAVLALASMAPAAAEQSQDLLAPVVSGPLTLAGALNLADAHAIAVAQMQADADVAQAASQSARAQTSVGVSANTYVAAGDSQDILASAPGVSPGNQMLTPGRGFGDENITLMVPLFTGGRLGSAARAALDQSLAADENVKAALLVSESAVAQAYLNASLQASLVDAAQARAAAEQAQVDVSAGEAATGKVAQVDLLREQAELADANQEVIKASNQAALALVDLKQALGVSESSQISIAQQPDDHAGAGPAMPAGLDQALSIARANRHELVAAGRLKAAAAEQLGSVRGEYAPQIYGQGMADGMLQSGMSRAGYTVGLALSIPLYDAGSRRADEAAAQARLRRAEIDAAQARLDIDHDVAAAWLDWQSSQSELIAARAGLAAASEASRLADLRYAAGKSNAAARLDAFAALTRARADLATARAQLASSRAKLLAACGLRPG